MKSTFSRLFFRLSLLLCLCLVVVLSANRASASSIRINAPVINLEIAPGGSVSGEFVVENPEAEEMSSRLYLEDWVYAKGGGGNKIFSPAKTTSRSGADWITFTPVETTLKPFGRVPVHYTVQVPRDASGGHYAVLFVETFLGSTRNEEGVAVNVAARVGTLFLVEVKGTTQRTGVIKSLEIRAPEGNRPLEILTTFQNTGNVNISLAGNFLIMDGAGKVYGRGELERIYTAPDAVESRTSQWVGRLPQGTYQMIATYDLGKGKSLVEERSFVVK